VQDRGASDDRGLAVYLELTKARLASLVVITTVVGYLVAAGGVVDWSALLRTGLGTALVACGANVLNQWWELRWDGMMERTRGRPLPSRRIRPRTAFRFGTTLSLLGCCLLAATVNILSAALAAATLLIYLLIYTPLKRRTTLCTLAGAVVGALPPMIGWAAATGRIHAGAWVLFVLMFIWQIPHFLAIAWMYRQDYERAGFRMLPVVDPTGGATCGILVVYCLALLPVSAAVAMVGLSGWIYLAGAVALGAGMLVLAGRLHHERTTSAARNVFMASIAYLPLLLVLMVMDPTSLF
jgi:protoheme IX farnesyltransferase